jgi:hypothetical protein
MLHKKQENRPTIEDLIYGDVFQNKSKTMRIQLPLELNKDKLIQKLKSNLLEKEGWSLE